MNDLNVVICGAGIGGLAAAAALRQRGIRTTVLEQAPELGEVGAGIQISPNAMRILERFGLGAEMKSLSPLVQEIAYRRWEDGAVLGKTHLGGYALERYGAPYLQLHRADVHFGLLDVATSEHGEGPAAQIVTNALVTSVDLSDPTQPAVVTDAGERYAADVVIGADGIRSVVRQATGGPDEVLDSGDMCFRVLFDGKSVKDDPATRVFADSQVNNYWIGPDKHIAVYPIRNYELVNFVGMVPSDSEIQKTGTRPTSVEELAAAYEGWDSRLHELFKKPVKSLMLFALMRQDSFSAWGRGHVALLGDACHSMVPYVAQGASQAIEDGYVIAEELASGAPIADALQNYSSRREPGAHRAQQAALYNQYSWHLHDGAKQQERDYRMEINPYPVEPRLDEIYRGTELKDGQVTAV